MRFAFGYIRLEKHSEYVENSLFPRQKNYASPKRCHFYKYTACLIFLFVSTNRTVDEH